MSITIAELFGLVGYGFDSVLTFIGSIRIVSLMFWSTAGPLLAWAWWQVFESIYLVWEQNRDERQQQATAPQK